MSCDSNSENHFQDKKIRSNYIHVLFCKVVRLGILFSSPFLYFKIICNLQYLISLKQVCFSFKFFLIIGNSWQDRKKLRTFHLVELISMLQEYCRSSIVIYTMLSLLQLFALIHKGVPHNELLYKYCLTEEQLRFFSGLVYFGP